MNEEYLPGSKASKQLGVHQRTLHEWDRKGLIDVIRTPGNKRMYNVKKYLCDKNPELYCQEEAVIPDNGNLEIIYARVSTHNQKNDLVHQIEDLQKDYPEYLLIKDIGSGINLNRKGLRRIIKLAIEGRVKKLVISHKDRLARFGFDLIEDLIKDYSKGEIIIVNKKENLEPEEELTRDVLAIMNIFVARMNGMRRYNKHKDN